MSIFIRRVIGFIPKHIGWYKSRKKDRYRFNSRDLIEIYDKYKEKKEIFSKVEIKFHSELYFDKTKVDKEYYELKGWIDCLNWLRSL